MLLLSLILTFTQAPQAQATLGEGEASIDNVRRAFGATRQAAVSGTARRNAATKFKMHELVAHPLARQRRSTTGAMVIDYATKVREYVNDKGQVFAVSWQGYRSPDLQSLLGGYAPEANRLEASPQSPKGRGARNRYLESKSLIVARDGHPRSLRGRYLSQSLAPAGVTIDDIQ